MTPDPHRALDDEALVAAAQAGDRDALDALLRRHHDRIRTLCRRLAGNEADTADATQEALVAIAKGLPRFDGRARFTTWAHRVATNACLDELRRRGRRPVPVDDDRGVLSAVPDPVSTAAPDRVGDRMDVDTALARLPLEFRAPVVLRDLCDLSYAEIADTLGLRPGTVRSRIARGRAALVDLLGPVAGGHPGNQAGPANVGEGTDHA